MIIKVGVFNNFVGAVTAVGMMAFMFGTAISWSSPVVPKLQKLTDDNPFGRIATTNEISWMTSLMVLGCCVGCWIFAYMANVLGRRFTMCTVGVPILTSYLLMAIFRSIPVYYVARFITGIGLGGGNVIQITFISEIASKNTRGFVSTIGGMMLGVGALASYCIGPYVPVTTLNIILAVNPLLVILVAILFCEESPYYYLMKNQTEKAKNALKVYRNPGVNVDEEIKEIKEKIEEQNSGKLIEVLKTKAFIKSFIIANMLLIFQQFTGINGITMYSQTIFNKTGSNLSPEICSIILGALNLASGSIAPFVAERFTRRFLLNLSAAGMIICESVLGIYCVLDDAGKVSSSLKFLPIVSLAGFMFTYNFGVGPLCWVVTSEIFVTRVKTFAMSFSVFIYYIIGFFIAQYFNPVSEAIGIGPVFFIFAGCCTAFILFVVFYVIETSAKTLEEIQDELSR
ncbi:facilitated trehalose transporter Tret1-like [Diabrotica virgifera virgifera]|uniref:Major facilitator superfamily (MFS) profile domain-containing protein n=1 Tax=Diabrotica virgifera virgifera TaxID=50390 RepID=A0ABM5K7H7_DIAVI|nr:facilitated trehalose transporter Tret1-like [Diabrotica virgifera virgifera]